MKIQVVLKDPDALLDALDNDAKPIIRKDLESKGLTKDEVEVLLETRLDKVHTQLRKWIESGEYFSIEFDTDADTARVMLADED